MNIPGITATPFIGPAQSERVLRLNYLIELINNGTFTRNVIPEYPLTLLWLELFLNSTPQAILLMRDMSEIEKRESIELLKSLRRENWTRVVLDFILANDVVYTNFLTALTSNESICISDSINYWDIEPLISIFKRTSPSQLSELIAQRIWYGNYFRYFSSFFFYLSGHLERSHAFKDLQQYISSDTVHKIIPAIREDVDVLLKWIVGASLSSHPLPTLRVLELIFRELNDNQQRRLILRSVKYYPETFLYILPLLSEEQALLICRNDLPTMSRFLLKNGEQCRELIPKRKRKIVCTFVTRGRFPLRDTFNQTVFHSIPDVLQVLRSVPTYEKEDLDYIARIPPFLFCFFDHWNKYSSELRLIINELTTPQLRALSLAINIFNAEKMMLELKQIMSPPRFEQFLSFFESNPQVIEKFLSNEYLEITTSLDKAETLVAQGTNLLEISSLTLRLKNYKQSPLFNKILILCEPKIPGIHLFLTAKLDTVLRNCETFFADQAKPPTESSTQLYQALEQKGDRDIGLINDDDLRILGITSVAHKALLDKYRDQPKLKDSWSIIHKKRMYSLKELELGCLLESPEECFRLNELAVKLL